jgi:uncharacterized protein (DUF1684 family)
MMPDIFRYIMSTGLCLMALNACGQTYVQDIAKFRLHYKEEFIAEANSPLKAADTAYLRFYEADESYNVVAEVTLTPDAKPFKILTYNKKERDYKEYAVLSFKLKGTAFQLHAYQNINWAKDDKLKNLLFIPFTDNTNNKETYGGGRYIDLDVNDIKDGKIRLDFNKCYNPYCAFADGYSCPVPPRENSLDISIKAGEKLFGKAH